MESKDIKHKNKTIKAEVICNFNDTNNNLKYHEIGEKIELSVSRFEDLKSKGFVKENK